MLEKTLVVVVLVLAAACSSGIAGESYTIPAGELSMRYRLSKEDVRSKFDGKRLIVRGYAMIGAEMPGDKECEGLIALDDGNGTSTAPSQILCWFSRKEIANFSRIRGDQQVTSQVP